MANTLQNAHMLSFSNLEEMALASGVAGRLLVSALLGGAVGLNRELHHKPSGIRTNLLICFACALFTFLSPIIAGETGNNKGQIAANIVQGIGFLGAGLILHNKIPGEWIDERRHGLCGRIDRHGVRRWPICAGRRSRRELSSRCSRASGVIEKAVRT